MTLRSYRFGPSVLGRASQGITECMHSYPWTEVSTSVHDSQPLLVSTVTRELLGLRGRSEGPHRSYQGKNKGAVLQGLAQGPRVLGTLFYSILYGGGGCTHSIPGAPQTQSPHLRASRPGLTERTQARRSQNSSANCCTTKLEKSTRAARAGRGRHSCHRTPFGNFRGRGSQTKYNQSRDPAT